MDLKKKGIASFDAAKVFRHGFTCHSFVANSFKGRFSLSLSWQRARNILLITRARVLHTYWLPHGFSNVMNVNLLSISTFSLHFLKASVVHAEMMENKALPLSRYCEIRLIIVRTYITEFATFSRTGNVWSFVNIYRTKRNALEVIKVFVISR